jgi:hypothetical protein
MLSLAGTAFSAAFLRKTPVRETWPLECNKMAACGADGDLETDGITRH